MNTSSVAYSRSNRSARRSGFTLIETLVALVVLLIGIFAILRLFPGGFLVIERSAELSSARELAAEQLALENGLVAVPESVVAASMDANGNVLPDMNVRPDDLRDFAAGDPSLPAGVTDPYYASNINRIRYIIGETFRIPVSGAINGREIGGVALLQQGPVYNVFRSLDSPHPDSVSVYGTPLSRVERPAATAAGQYDDTVVLANDNDYAIDYTKMLVGFYPRRTSSKGFRRYKISFDYYTAGANNTVSLHSVIDGPGTVFTVPDDPSLPSGADRLVKWTPLFNDSANNYPNSLPLPTGMIGMRRNSEDVSRKFALVSVTPVLANDGTLTAPGWSADDAYEYAWLSQQQGPDANAGVLVFNPIAHNQLVQTAAGNQPLTARVDYQTYDNHILREERSVPAQAPYDVKLSLQQVMTNGDTLDDQSTYTGMFRVKNADSPDLMVLNANTGLPVAVLTKGAFASSIGLKAVLDARNGILRLDPATVESNNLQNASLRIYYRAAREWGMQIQKANAHYAPADLLTDMTYRSYYVGGSDPADTLKKSGRIYFPVSEAGKTVVIGEYWLKSTTGGSTAVPVRHTNEAFRINADSNQFENPGNGPMSWIDVAPDSSMALDPTETGKSVVNVSGGSLKSRVIWRSATRWRRVDNDTFLPQAPLH